MGAESSIPQPNPKCYPMVLQSVNIYGKESRYKNFKDTVKQSYFEDKILFNDKVMFCTNKSEKDFFIDIIIFQKYPETLYDMVATESKKIEEFKLKIKLIQDLLLMDGEQGEFMTYKRCLNLAKSKGNNLLVLNENIQKVMNDRTIIEAKQKFSFISAWLKDE